MKIYVLYHANCWDGFCAAWVARKILKDTAEYIPVNYGEPEPEMLCGSVVYLLDFSYPRETMRNLLSQMHRVIVLDHHKTAESELAGLVQEFIDGHLINRIPDAINPEIKFDVGKSGGRLAWEYFFPSSFFPSSTNGRSWIVNHPPWIVNYTEDRDLWRWKLPKSPEINAFLRSWPLDFEKWDELSHIEPESIRWNTWVVAGSAILRREKQIIDEHVRHAREIELDGHKVLTVNATVLFSEIAGELAKRRPFGTCYFDRADTKRQWSLRSTDEGVDVSEIAKRHGGGGHRNAAGFEEANYISQKGD